jgi:hypothetical protein
MIATSSPRHKGGNWTTRVVYCDQPCDPANLAPLPISTVPKHATMQTRLMRIGTDIDNVEMVTTDDGGRIPVQYQEFVKVFTKKKVKTVPPNGQIDHPIDLEPDYKLPYGRIYNLTELELKTLKAYIETNLANSFIQRSSSSAAVPSCLERRQTEDYIVCRLSSSQPRHGNEMIRPSSNFRTTRSSVRSPDLH